MNNIIFILSLLPSVTFSLVSAEIFPWAILFVIVSGIKLDKNILIFIFMLFSSAIITFLLGGAENGEIIRVVASYLNGLLIYYSIKKIELSRIIKFAEIYKRIYLALIFIGLIQYFRFIDLNLLTNYLIPRGNDFESYESLRGVSLLSSEPSRAAYELILMYIGFNIFIKEKLTFKFEVIHSLLIFIFLLIVIKSITGVALFSCYLIIRTKRYLESFIVLILFIVILSLINYKNEVGRIYEILIIIISANSLDEIILKLTNLSGARFISLYFSLYSLLFYPFGNGVGGWITSSLQIMRDLNIDPASIDFFVNHSNSTLESIRPSSVLANIALDMGIVGIWGFMLILKNCKLKKSEDHSSRALYLYFILLLLINSDVGNPIPWITIGLAERIKGFTSLAETRC